MAYNFVRASSQYIDVAGLPDFTTQFSCSFWYRAASSFNTANFYPIFSKHKDADGNDRNTDIDFRGKDGVLSLSIDWSQPTSTFIEYYFGTTPTIGTWYQALITVDWTTNPDTIHWYLNGTEQTVTRAGSNDATPTTGSPQVAFIGRRFGNYFDGDIAEVGIWSTIRTADEAKALSKFAPDIVHPTGLKYAPLVRDLIDPTGNCTLTNNSATVSNHPPVIKQ